MGLDITVYSNLVKVSDEISAELNAMEEPREEAYERDLFSFYENEDFPGRIGSIDPKAFYSSETEPWSFRAGSYSGYSQWREWLADFAGVKLPEFWHNFDPTAPFAELIHFSDAEGTLGPEVCARLAKDFDRFENMLPWSGDDWDFQRYKSWQKACHDASQNGAIEFH